MRFAVLGLAIGLLFQGCTIQKRSHLPGWHVERATALSSKVPEEPEAVVDVKAEPAEKVLEVAVVPAPLPSLKLLCLKTLELRRPSFRSWTSARLRANRHM